MSGVINTPIVPVAGPIIIIATSSMLASNNSCRLLVITVQAPPDCDSAALIPPSHRQLVSPTAAKTPALRDFPGQVGPQMAHPGAGLPWLQRPDWAILPRNLTAHGVRRDE